jgi:GNAT superfamily N-acetyltransferase
MLSSEYEVSCDRDRLDVSMIHAFLRESYWAAGRTRETVERSITNSLCFGVYAADKQIAFARVITDCAVFAYLADVFVVPEFRGRGVSKLLMRAIMSHPDLQHLRAFTLGTRDAQGLYSQFGFGPISEPERLMARYGPELTASA